MGKIQKGVNVTIDGLAGILVLVLAYQYFWGEDEALKEGWPVFFVMLICIFAAWLLKAVSGVVTRPMDALAQKVDEIPIKDGE